MLVLGVDPGQKGAASCWANGHFVWSKQVPNTMQDVTAVLQWLRKEGEQQGGQVVVLERQYQSRGDKSNPRTVETLMRSRFLWEILAGVMQIEVVLVWPATWQTQLAVAPPRDDRGRKLSTKKKAVWVARHFVKDRSWTDGEADATLIARWWLKKRRSE